MTDKVEESPESAGSVIDSAIKNKAWYVVHTYSGYEQKVKGSLEEQFGQGDGKLGEVIIPTEEVVEIRQGKKRVTTRKFFPGYILIALNAKMDDEMWHRIKETPKVTGFPGGAKGPPAPLTGAEVKGILDQIRGEAQKPKPKVSFEKGENVRVIEGPFVNFSGVVDEVNPDKGKVKVMVSIFGRATPVELEFPQVEKI